MTVLGIDTSHHNPLPDFAALKRSGIGFVFAKATEGLGFVDPQYAASRAGAHSVGQIFGGYHFARPGDPVAQADYFLAHATPRPGELTELDLEDTAIADPVAFSAAWCERVKARTGAPPLIYLNSWFLGAYDWRPVLAVGDGLWLARYDGQPTGGPSGIWPVVAFKQFTDRATVPGQPGQVDEDAFNGDLATLVKYAIPQPQPPAPAPVPAPQEVAMLLVSTPSSGIWCLDGIGYHHIKEPATVANLQAAGVAHIAVSDAEHAAWVADQAALRGLPAPAGS